MNNITTIKIKLFQIMHFLNTPIVQSHSIQVIAIQSQDICNV